MRRLPLFSLFALLIALLFLSACGPSPKARANKYAERMPDVIGEFRREDARVELTAEAIGSTGHVTLLYAQRAVGELYVVIDVYGTESAANVAIARRERDFRLLGYTFDTDRQGRAMVARIAELPQGRIAIFQNDEVVIELEYIREPDAEMDEASWEAFLTAIRTVDGAVEGRQVVPAE